MTIRSELKGTFTLSELDRLLFPVCWRVTKDAGDAAAEEDELREMIREAKEELEDAATYSEYEGELAIKLENGKIFEIVEV